MPQPEVASAAGGACADTPHPYAGHQLVVLATILLCIAVFAPAGTALEHLCAWRWPAVQRQYLILLCVGPLVGALSFVSFLIPKYNALLESLAVGYDGLALWAFARMVVAVCGTPHEVARALAVTLGPSALVCRVRPPLRQACCGSRAQDEIGDGSRGGAPGSAVSPALSHNVGGRACCWLAQPPRDRLARLGESRDGRRHGVRDAASGPKARLLRDPSASRSSGSSGDCSAGTADDDVRLYVYQPWVLMLRRRFALVGQFGLVKLALGAAVALVNLRMGNDKLTMAERGVNVFGVVAAAVAGNSLFSLVAMLRPAVMRVPRVVLKLVVIKSVVLFSVLQRLVLTEFIDSGHLRLPPAFTCIVHGGEAAAHGHWPLDAEYGTSQFLGLLVLSEMAMLGAVASAAFRASDTSAGPGALLRAAGELVDGDTKGDETLVDMLLERRRAVSASASPPSGM